MSENPNGTRSELCSIEDGCNLPESTFEGETYQCYDCEREWMMLDGFFYPVDPETGKVTPIDTDQ